MPSLWLGDELATPPPSQSREKLLSKIKRGFKLFVEHIELPVPSQDDGMEMLKCDDFWVLVPRGGYKLIKFGKDWLIVKGEDSDPANR